MPGAPSGSGPEVGVPEAGGRLGNVLARAAAVTAGLTVAGAALGLVRDQTIAQIYGASTDSDAFLIAWTVPEMAATLLIEDAMALLLVPAFSHAIAARAARTHTGDPVRELLRTTFPRFLAVLTAATGALVVLAPQFVHALAPGFPEPALAVDCTRLTALTVLTYGLAGYFSAALRAHGRFLPPASVYIASNVGIIGTALLLNSFWGVRGAATGVAVGGLLMVLVQLPSVLRHVAPPRRTGLTGRKGRTGHLREALRGLGRRPRPPAVPLVGLALLAPIVLFAISRQAQVLVERHLASALPGGAISHLNYAQKIAQMPMVLSLMFCTVTFPVVAQAVAEGDHERARSRVEHDLALAGLVVLLGTAIVFGCAPQIVEVLFERGAFDHHDTGATASVMRVYALGLIGHTLVGALGRPFFSSGRPTWFPAAAMAVGLAVTIGAGALTVDALGIHGIAAANAAGICVTAVLLLRGLGPRVVAVEVRAVTLTLARLAAATTAGAAAGLLVAPLTGAALPGLVLGTAAVTAAFAATGHAVRAPEVVHLLALARRRFRHVR
ncbi:lipid II flippase MurJ [Streptomyces sp. NPDC000594]|uniref:lipid II flippase MurJ n=1 Tax=Streptomyces sp. NPDC000594 TaxID=3154261 RepID=UPI003325EC48